MSMRMNGPWLPLVRRDVRVLEAEVWRLTDMPEGSKPFSRAEATTFRRADVGRLCAAFASSRALLGRAAEVRPGPAPRRPDHGPGATDLAPTQVTSRCAAREPTTVIAVIAMVPAPNCTGV